MERIKTFVYKYSKKDFLEIVVDDGTTFEEFEKIVRSEFGISEDENILPHNEITPDRKSAVLSIFEKSRSVCEEKDINTVSFIVNDLRTVSNLRGEIVNLREMTMMKDQEIGEKNKIISSLLLSIEEIEGKHVPKRVFQAVLKERDEKVNRLEENFMKLEESERKRGEILSEHQEHIGHYTRELYDFSNRVQQLERENSELKKKLIRMKPLSWEDEGNE